MWILSWTKYKHSGFATFISVVAALTRYGGVLCLFASAFIGAIICIAIGIGLHFLAEEIGYRGWIKFIRKNNLEEPVRNGDLNTAINIYNAYPNKRTLSYIESLNPNASAYISNQINNK